MVQLTSQSNSLLDLVFRPADGNETAGAYREAITNRDAPSVIALSRQKVAANLELCLCEESAKMLRKEGRRVRVVSLVCWQLFNRQPKEYKEHVLPSSVSKRISVEAGSSMGWSEYVGREGIVMGVEEFGASGAYLDTFKKFGFTEENVTRVAMSLLSQY
ncbi:hypothetical protein NC652_026683 [Populus alba x Populus x berolinensis]|nr:hypothetical protein NC652_026683 [Populus alba x Populus x berolinensis]